jgi:hypothetical protein
MVKGFEEYERIANDVFSAMKITYIKYLRTTDKERFSLSVIPWAGDTAMGLWSPSLSHRTDVCVAGMPGSRALTVQPDFV